MVNASPTAGELALLRESVREVMGARASSTPDDGWPQSWRNDWAALSELGLWSTIDPPEGSLGAATVVAEELGRALYPGPSSEVIAASYVLNALGRATDDNAVFVTGTAELDDTGATVHSADVDTTVAGDMSSMLVVATERDQLVGFLPEGADIDDSDSLDVTRRSVRMRLTEQSVGFVSSDAEIARRGRAVKSLLYCADTLGCIEYILRRATEYALQRSTFGQPIGKYQAVAHRLVDHTIAAQQMRVLLEGAVEAFDARAEDVSRRVALAETMFCGRSAELISDCIQLAGAIGFTWEFGHHFYLRRVIANTALGGGAGRPHQRLAAVATW